MVKKNSAGDWYSVYLLYWYKKYTY